MKVFITSSLPYCNNEPHMGTILTILSGDIYARFKRALGCDVIFSCGTDEYGSTTTVRAKKENLTCRELCDKYGQAQKIVYDWFNIKFDAWGHTSNPEQCKITSDIFMGLYGNGFIEEKEIIQPYCNQCSMFLADQYIKGYCYNSQCLEKSIITNGDQCDYCQLNIDVDKLIKPYCSICLSTPTTKASKHLFLKLADLTESVSDYVENKIYLNAQAMSIAKAWIKSGLKSRCITRDLSWGTAIPNECNEDSILDNKVFYVWFDAPFGYYSILANHCDNWREWLQDPDLEWTSMQGKDNIPFHTIIFPASILGSGKSYPLITKICSTNYLLYQGQKFSKSNNIGIFGNQIINMSSKLGINEDYWRFYLMKIRPENNDSSFTWDEFVTSINSDLVNNVGNFINRCISLTNKYCNNKICIVIDSELHANIATFVKLMQEFKFKSALRFCLELSSRGNLSLSTTKPWFGVKNNLPWFGVKNNLSTAQENISDAMAICWILLHLIYFFIPSTIGTILSGAKCDVDFVYDYDSNLDSDLANNPKINIEWINKIDLPFKKLDLTEIKSLVN